ncbi:hypothetical protein OG596_04640 [Streptomyces sp. NBC_01102]|uniref:hypothetical protein n=1 Tax=unclassified Streptomyces TaxID=2593676 RepID=UPI003863D0E0|nr:hypothetical protein OG596_04640 [Streptomyces sp. NBC_01102]
MRGATARFVLTILTALLLALQFPAPTTLLPAAHNTQATGSPERLTGATAGQVAHHPVRTYHGTVHDGEPNGLLRNRDRHHRAAAGSATDTLVRCIVADVSAGRRSLAAPAAPGATSRVSRPPASPTPASLQVFRC